MRFSAGTGHSSSVISPVGEPRTPSLRSSFETLKPGNAFSTTKQLMPAMAGVGIGLGEHRVEVADARVGDPQLASGEHVVVAVADGSGAHARHVAPGVGLREAVRRLALAAATRVTYFCLSASEP